MAKKGVNHISEAGEAAVEKLAQVGEIKATANEEMVDSLKKTEESKEKNVENQYPNHKGYTELWKSLSPDQQKRMKENIKITADGKVEIIKMKKKFSQLTQQNRNQWFSIDGSYVDKNGNTGIKGVSYLTGKAAEQEAEYQGKRLFDYKFEVEHFVRYFPGETQEEKISNVVKMFGLEKSGNWHYGTNERENVGSVSVVGMTHVDKDNDVCLLEVTKYSSLIFKDLEKFPYPYLAFEDC